MPLRIPTRRLAWVLLVAQVCAGVSARGDVTVAFSTADPGVTKSIPNWGLDTNWADLNNMRRGLAFMGPANVNVVRVPALVDAAVDNGLTAAQQTHLQQAKDLAALVGPNAKWDMCAPGSTVAAWYQTGGGTVDPTRWVQALTLAQQFYQHAFWSVEPFNEPDYAPWGEGSQQNLSDIMGGLQSAPGFAGALMAGGSTMSTDQAGPWFDAVSSRAGIGTTHCLYGTVANYIGFIQHVIASHGLPVNPEGHNVVEAIYGAEYGLNTVIWWGTAERTRGDFVRASGGVRLGYAEDPANWTAAAVYRSPAGAVQAFVGSGERVGGSTTYVFHATDRDVYYDGHGPQRDYAVTVARNQERVINITWGPDPEPAIGGRYAIVNDNSGLALAVAGDGTSAGDALEQAAFSGATGQLWDVAPLAATAVGDTSYFLLTNANSGLNADVADWQFDDGAPVKQYGYPDNSVEHWFFEYVGNGSFAIRSRWSDKCLAVTGASRGVGAAVVQQTYRGTPEQLWHLRNPASVPAAQPLAITSEPPSVSVAPAQTVVLSATAAGTGAVQYQWQWNGSAIAGATDPQLVLSDIQAAQAGAYTVVATDALTSVASAAANVTVQTTSNPGRLINLSIRSNAGAGDQTLIAGFAVDGGGKQLLIRGIGPTLANYGVGGALPAAELTLFSGQQSLATNAGWGGDATLASVFNAVGAFPLPGNSADAVLLSTVNPGVYSVHVTGQGGSTGVALAEIYDAQPGAAPASAGRLINVSARCEVGTGDNRLIAGFVIGGATGKTLLIRGVGPSLAQYGVANTLVDPQLALHDSAASVIASNDDWGGGAVLANTFARVGAFPYAGPTSADAALLVTLPPGAYSAVLQGAGGGTGIGMVEIYEVP